MRLTNEHFYFLTFPAPPTKEDVGIDYSLLAEQSQRSMVLKKRPGRATAATVDLTAGSSDEDEGEGTEEDEDAADGYFSICGMVDGVADALTISAEDEWGSRPSWWR